MSTAVASESPVKKIMAGLFALIILSSLVSIWVWYLNHKSAESPAKLGLVGAFQLTDSSNQPFGSEQLKDKTWVANFIFTSCQGPCPILSTRVSEIAREFATQQNLQFVTVTVDPETDTPEVLANYAKQYTSGTAPWAFLTGDAKQIESLMSHDLKLGYAENIMFHSDRLVLVDRSMQIRGFYTGSEGSDLSKLKNDLNKVLAE